MSAFRLASFAILGAAALAYAVWTILPPAAPSGEAERAVNEALVQAETAPPTVEPSMLFIPEFDVVAPIIFVEERNEDAFQAALANGVGHYPGTAEIGEAGNAYLFGHSSDYPWAPGEYKTVFARLPEMEIGDEIFASNAEGVLFRYVVVETKIVEPDDASVLAQDETKKRLTLQTSYPVGTARQRYLVIAELAPLHEADATPTQEPVPTP